MTTKTNTHGRRGTANRLDRIAIEPTGARTRDRGGDV